MFVDHQRVLLLSGAGSVELPESQGKDIGALRGKHFKQLCCRV